jgi:hypothetical protein
MYVLNYEWLIDFVRQVCEHDRIEIRLINEMISDYASIMGREPLTLAPLLTYNNKPIDLIKAGPHPVEIPVRTEAVSPTTNAAPTVTRNAPEQVQVPQTPNPVPATQTQGVPFTYTIQGKTTEETKVYITSIIQEYKVQIGGKKGSWTGLSKLIRQHLAADRILRPLLDAGRTQIVELCRDNGVVLRR